MVDPHIVGKNSRRERVQVRLPEEYAFTYLNFSNMQNNCRTGGFAHVKTLLDHLRKEAGGRANTLTVDGGDLGGALQHRSGLGVDIWKPRTFSALM